MVQQEIMETIMENITSPAPRRELSSIWLKALPISTKISINRMGRARAMISALSVNRPINGPPKRKIRVEPAAFSSTAMRRFCMFSR